MSSSGRPVFAYLRVSTRRQDEENQRIQIARFAESHGFTVLDWFKDHAVSGTTSPLEREGFGAMHSLLTSIKAEKPESLPKHVLVYELTRLGRNFWDLMDVVRHLEELAPVISTSPLEAFLQTEDEGMRQIFFSIGSWFAGLELKRTKQRIREGLNRAQMEGRFAGRNVPIGYNRHDCIRLGHAKIPEQFCREHGRLAINALGEAALAIVLEYGDRTTASVLRELIDEPLTPRQAYSLLVNVRKFGSNPGEVIAKAELARAEASSA